MLPDLTFADAGRADADARSETSRGAFVMDEETFRAFYDRNARGIRMYLARITGDRQCADDLLQEAFYRFLRADATHDSEVHRRNSLYRIATNVARDARRRTLLRPAVSAGSGIEHVAAADHAGATERGAEVTQAMSHLKARDRAMLWLAYAEGASHREIAEILGLSPNSMKLLLFRARGKLAALLGPGRKGAE